MSIISFIQTERNINIFVDGCSHIVPLNDGRVDDLLEAVRNGDEDRVRQLIDTKQTLSVITEGRVAFDPVTRVLTFNDEPLHNGIIDRLCIMLDQNRGVTHMMKFLDNLMDNPDYRAVRELYGFIEACDLPITSDGHFLAYKIVSNDYKDLYTGKIDNSIGASPEMARNMVNPDKDQPCSVGLHVCSKSYLPHYGGFYGKNVDSRVVIAKVHPRDVVSVPSDYDNAKMRVCRYTVVDEIPWDEIREDTRMSGYVTDLYGDYVAEDDDDDNEWDDFDEYNVEEDGEVVDNSSSSVKTGAVQTKLTEHQVRDIVRMLDDGVTTIASVARLYNVNESTIRKIRDGVTWSKVTGRTRS